MATVTLARIIGDHARIAWYEEVRDAATSQWNGDGASLAHVPGHTGLDG
jgi:hypothetical protein